MLIALAKIPEHEGSISPSSFSGQLHMLALWAHMLALST